MGCLLLGAPILRPSIGFRIRSTAIDVIGHAANPGSFAFRTYPRRKFLSRLWTYFPVDTARGNACLKAFSAKINPSSSEQASGDKQKKN